jgi:hypothetical protein
MQLVSIVIHEMLKRFNFLSHITEFFVNGLKFSLSFSKSYVCVFIMIAAGLHVLQFESNGTENLYRTVITCIT